MSLISCSSVELSEQRSFSSRPIVGNRRSNAVLRWYCEAPKDDLCFDRREELVELSDDDLEIARIKLFALPFSMCPCGTRIIRSMHVEEI